MFIFLHEVRSINYLFYSAKGKGLPKQLFMTMSKHYAEIFFIFYVILLTVVFNILFKNTISRKLQTFSHYNKPNELI